MSRINKIDENMIDDNFTKKVRNLEEDMVDTNQQLAETVKKQKNISVDVVVDELIVANGTDVTSVLTEVVENTDKLNLYFPYSADGFVINELVIPYFKDLKGNNTKISADQLFKRIFYFTNHSQLIENPSVEGFVISQPVSGGGGGTDNDHSPVSFWGSKNAKVLHNVFKNSSLGLTFNYGQKGLSDRTGNFNLAAFNFFDTIEKMAIEMLGSSYNRVIGNAIDGKGGDSHGVRFSGYGTDNINTKSVGSVVTANIISGMYNAYSLQNTAKYNSFSTSHSSNLTWGVVSLTAPTLPENSIEFNFGSGLTFDNVKHAIHSVEGQYNHFSLVGTNITDTAVVEKNASSLSLDGHNKYEGIFKNIGADGVYLLRKNNRLDVDLINVTGTGVMLANGADGTTGNIKVDKADVGVNIYSNNNILNVHVTNCTEVSGKSIQIIGNNNTINLYTDKNVFLGGTGNKLIGYIGGTVTKNGSGVNDFSGITGYSLRKTVFSQTSDGSGKIILAHGLKTSVLAVLVSTYGATPNTVKVRTVDATNITFELYDKDGVLLPLTNATFSFMAEAY